MKTAAAPRVAVGVLLAASLAGAAETPAEGPLPFAHVLWRHPCVGGFAIADGIVYASEAEGLAAIDAARGTVVWRRTLPRLARDSRSTAPVVLETRVAQARGPQTFVLDRTTGQQSALEDGAARPTSEGRGGPAAGEDELTWASSGSWRGGGERGAVHRQDRKTGERLWSSRIPAFPRIVLLHGDRVFVAGGDGRLYVLDARTGETLRVADGLGLAESMGAVGEVLVVEDAGATLSAVSLTAFDPPLSSLSPLEAAHAVLAPLRDEAIPYAITEVRARLRVLGLAAVRALAPELSRLSVAPLAVVAGAWADLAIEGEAAAFAARLGDAPEEEGNDTDCLEQLLRALETSAGPAEIPAVAAVVDVLQTPAFLCRQTDFVVAVAAARLGVWALHGFGLRTLPVLRTFYVGGLGAVILAAGAAFFTYGRRARLAIAGLFGAGAGLVVNELSVLLAFDVFYRDVFTLDPRVRFDPELLYRRSESVWIFFLLLAVLLQVTYFRHFYRRATYLLLESWRARRLGRVTGISGRA